MVNGREPSFSACEWRPLLNGEYPPPGPTKYGERYYDEETGLWMQPIFVLVSKPENSHEVPL